MDPNQPEQQPDQTPSADANGAHKSARKEKIIQPPARSTAVKLEPDTANTDESPPSESPTQQPTEPTPQQPLITPGQTVGPATGSAGNDQPPESGSPAETETSKTPKGVYILAALLLLSVVAFVFSPAEKGWLSILLNGGLFAMSIGLLLRYDVARKVIIGFAAIIAIAATINIFLIANLQNTVQEQKAQLEDTIEDLRQQDLTLSQQRDLQELEESMAEKEEQAGTGLTLLLAWMSWWVIYSLIIIFYLIRPKVKQAFH